MLKPRRAAPDHELLFLERYDALVTQARRVLNLTRDRATELVHEGFLQFVRLRPDLDLIVQIDAYLFGMLRKIHLSDLRRAARQRALSIAQYDSAAIALRDRHGRDEAQALQELARICAYCAIRKETSKAASLLALRYFYGYMPPALARLARATPGAVAQWLHLARREARLFVEAANRLAFCRSTTIEPPSLSVDLDEDARLVALIEWLRTHRAGACLSRAEIARWSDANIDPVDCQTLSHLVSCAPCLSAVDAQTGAGNDRAAPLSGTAGGDGGGHLRLGSQGGPVDTPRGERHRARLTEVRAHRPLALYVHVNGYLVGSHRLTGADNELTVRAHLHEAFDFVEVFSEQGLRLAWVDAESLVERREMRIALDDERDLTISSDVSDAWPSITVHYEDPRFAAHADDIAADETTLDQVPGQLAVPEVSVHRPTWARWRARLPRYSWRAVAWRLAVVLLIVWALAGPSEAAQMVVRVSRAVRAYVTTFVEGLFERPAIPASSWSDRTLVPFAVATHERVGLHWVPATTNASSANLTSLEIRVLSGIDRASGLLGDEVRVERSRDRIRVWAMVAGEDRRRELVSALGSLAQDARVTVDVSTVRQALAARARPTEAAAQARVRVWQPSQSRVPAYEAIRAALMKRPAADAADDLDADVRRFAIDVLNRSLDVRLHTRAVVGLVDRFTLDELTAVGPAALREWAEMVGGHARAAQQGLASLRASLDEVFWSSDSTAPGVEPDAEARPRVAEKMASMAPAAAELFERATGHDASIARAFAISTETLGDMTAAQPGFRASLIEAERLAHALADVAAGLGAK